MSEIAERRMPRFRTASVDSWLNAQLLPAVLGGIAGSVDAVSFLGLGRLFVAHVTNPAKAIGHTKEIMADAA